MSNFKILVINLEKNLYRHKKLEQQLIQYDISNYLFIPAINGDTLKDNELIELPKSLYRKNTNSPREIPFETIYFTHFHPNEIACIKSHIIAINLAIKLNLDYVIILEDDIIICQDWNTRLEKLLILVPKNWTHIYLSGQPDESIEKFHPLNFAPFLHVEQSIATEGAFSYMLKKEVFEVVKENLLKFSAPTDTVIKQLIAEKKLISYTFYPFLSYHDNNIVSDIWKKEYKVDHDSKRYFVNKL